jgi:hypothetical protein
MNWSVFISWARSGVLLGLVLLLLVTAPFAVAQDVHHELAAADTDGHEHSDTDICQWVQQHTSGSVDLSGAVDSVWTYVRLHDVSPRTIQLSLAFISVGPSRAPPQI